MSAIAEFFKDVWSLMLAGGIVVVLVEWRILHPKATKEMGENMEVDL